VLLIIINKNKAEKVIFAPLFLMMIFISLNSVKAIRVGVMLFFEGISQTLFGIIMAISVILSQFRCRGMIDEAGSKIEKRFIIIFSLFLFLLFFFFLFVVLFLSLRKGQLRLILGQE